MRGFFVQVLSFVALIAMPFVASTTERPSVPPRAQLHLDEAAAKRAAVEGTHTRFGVPKSDSSWAPELAPSTIDVIHYDLDLHLDFGEEIAAGSVEMTFEAVQDGLTSVSLDADQGLRVLGVLLVQDGSFPHDSSRSLDFNHSNDTITITLHRSLAPGERLRLLIPYGGHASRSGYGVNWSYTGYGSIIAWTMAEPFGARVWWPCNDRPDDKALVDLRVTAPADFTVASNGLETGRVVNADGTATTSWSSRYPVATYLVVMDVSDFVYSERDYEAEDGSIMPVVVYAYPPIADEAETDLAITPTLIEVLADAFGEYPFVEEKYGNLTAPFGGGMEHQTLTTFSSSAVGDPWSQWLNVHELGHQWWGDWVNNDDWRELWLNEGFATYSEWVWAEHLGPEVLDQVQDEADWWGHFTGALYDNPVMFSRTVYEKGAWTLHMLRYVVGDEAFFDAVAAYRDAHGGASAKSEDLREIFEQVSGMELDWFFEQWVYGLNRPRYQYSWTEVQGPAVRLTVEQKHSNAAFFRMPMDVKISGSGWSETETVWLEAAASQTIDIPVQGSATTVELDPDRHVLCELGPSSAPDLDLGPDFPGPIDGGVLPLGSSTTFTVPLNNVGGSELQIFEIYPWFGGRAFAPVSPSSFPVTIAPGASTDLEISFSPNGTGALTETLTIVSNDPSHGGETNLRLAGVGAMFEQPFLNAPTSISVGHVALGSVGESGITISNLGAAPLSLSATLTGEDFAMASVLPDSLAAGERARLIVRLAPQSEGQKDGSIVLETNDPLHLSHTITLRGDGDGAPRLTVDPPMVDLGLASGEVSSQLVISNSGTENLSITSMTADSPFVLPAWAASPVTVAPGGELVVEISCSDVSSGTVEGSLTILSNDPALPTARVPVKTYGIEAVPNRWAFAAVAHSGGVGGALWSTDAVFLNTSQTDAALDLRFMPATARAAHVPDLSLSVPARGQRSLADIVALAGQGGTGGLEIVGGGGAVIPVSRTFSTEHTGTYGQFIPAVSEDDLLVEGQIYVLAGLATGGFHSNFGILNLGEQSITAKFVLFDTNGVEVGSFDLDADAGAYAQNVDAYADFTTATIRGGFATVSSSTPGAVFSAFASVVDDSSHDPTYISPLIPAAAAGGVIVPVVAAQEGDLGTMWRSEVSVVHIGEGAWNGTFSLYSEDGVLLAQGAFGVHGSGTFDFHDVMRTLGQYGVGWLEIVCSEELVVTSRTYNDDSSGTYGQFIAAVMSTELSGSDDTVVLPGLRSDGGFRTNIGVTSLAASATTVAVRVFREDGQTIGTVDIEVPARGFAQAFRVLQNQLGYEGAAWATVSSDDPDALFFVHASVVDGATGDPIFIPAVPMPDGAR